jgi:hypothetical protein
VSKTKRETRTILSLLESLRDEVAKYGQFVASQKDFDASTCIWQR